MGKLLYSMAIVLIIFWAVGLIGFHAGKFIHIMLLIAIVIVVIKIISGKKI